MRVFTTLCVLILWTATVGFASGEAETSEAEYQSHFWSKQLVTPFTGDQATTHRMRYDTFKRDMTTQSNYRIFLETAREVLQQTGKCQFGSSVEDALQSCANEKPDEFATVTNMIRYYIDWSQGEQQTVLDLYKSQLGSPLLHERLEARLVLGCVKHEMQTRDTLAAVNICKDSSSWDLSSVMSVPCKDPRFSTREEFDYDKFISQCVLTDAAKESKGADIVKMVLPDFNIHLRADSVDVTVAPPAVHPASMYAALVLMRKQAIQSPWLLDLETQGCLPSAFAPSDFGSLTAAERKPFYSMCLPTSLIQALGQLPQEDIRFYAEVLARKLAYVDMMEALDNAALITAHCYSVINATDREVGQMVEPFIAYSKQTAESYKNSIDLTMTTTFEDVLEAVSETLASYYEADVTREQVTDSLAEDLQMLEDRTRTGAGY